VTTTTVNLVSSSVAAELVPATERVDLPLTFFVDHDGLSACVKELTAGAPLEPSDLPVTVHGRTYAEVSAELGVHVLDAEGRRIPGDTHFAFVVPERSFEDLAVVAALLRRQVLGARLGLCALMVDFPNPVFSRRRARLLRYFPADAAVGSGGQELDAEVVAAVRAHSVPGAAVLRLAESRRNAFRRRPLAEFPPSTARFDIHVPALRMTEDAAVVAADHAPEESP
jgi:hypothetical protein